MEVESSMVILGGGGIRALNGNGKNTITKLKWKNKKELFNSDLIMLCQLTLVCHSFLDTGRRHEISRSDTKNFITLSAAQTAPWAPCLCCFPCPSRPTGLHRAAYIDAANTMMGLHPGCKLWVLKTSVCYYNRLGCKKTCPRLLQRWTLFLLHWTVKELAPTPEILSQSSVHYQTSLQRSSRTSGFQYLC